MRMRHYRYVAPANVRLLVRGACVAEGEVPLPLPDLPGIQRHTVRRRGRRTREGCRAEKRGQHLVREYRLPPNFNRGVCRTCGKPVVEVAGAGPFKVMFIPASNFEIRDRLPPVRVDIFYHRRVQDMHDSLPKYSGYFASEWAVGKLIMAGL